MPSQPEGVLKKNAKAGRAQEKFIVGLGGKFASDSANIALGSVKRGNGYLGYWWPSGGLPALEELGE